MIREVMLDGKWKMSMFPSRDFESFTDGDITSVLTCAAFDDSMIIPGTTAQQKKGMLNTKPEEGYLTERYPFSGCIFVRKKIKVGLAPGQRCIFCMERTRLTRVFIDGREITAGEGSDSLLAPHRYDITDHINGDEQSLSVMISNMGYPVPGGHLTSPDTQTNWIGICGKTALIIYDSVFTEDVTVHAEITHNNKIDGGVDRGADEVRDHGRKAAVDLTVINSSDDEREINAGLFIRGINNTDKGDAGEIIFERRLSLTVRPGHNALTIDVPSDRISFWDEYNTAVYSLVVEIRDRNDNSLIDKKELITGFRDIRTEGLSILVNNNKVFLRGKHDGMVFPLTGAAPTDLDSWLKVMGEAKKYGINHYRFHTCCPPEAAFTAADILGIYMSPELPFWGTVADRGEEGFDEKGQEFLVSEGLRMLKEYGNHPSFVMMSLGNELWGSDRRLNEIIGIFKKSRNDKLFTQGSNNFQFVPRTVPEEDYFVGVRFGRDRLIRGSYAMCDAPQGFVQTEEPGTGTCFDECFMLRETDITDESKADCERVNTETPEDAGEAEYMNTEVPEDAGEAECMNAEVPGDAGEAECVNGAWTEELRESPDIEIQFGTGVKVVSAEETDVFIPDKPVISHETGQYSMYPDIRREDRYSGVLRADNFAIYRERLDKAGLLPYLDDIIRDSGKLAVQCYKLEIEAAHRSKLLSGYQLLDLQDFPGQGGAYVGILDAFMESKGIVSEEEWLGFAGDITAMAEMPRFVYTEGEEVKISFKLRNDKLSNSLNNIKFKYSLNKIDEKCDIIKVIDHGEISVPSEKGLTDVGEKVFTMPAIHEERAVRLRLNVSCDASEYGNSYDIWVFPELNDWNDRETVIKRFESEGIYTAFSEEDLSAIPKDCRKVLFLPDNSGRSGNEAVMFTYASDFWCYPMFRSISESMGKRIPVGTLGLSIRKDHPAVSMMSSETFSTPAWYKIAEGAYLPVLDGTDAEVIVRGIDNIERCHSLGLLYETERDGKKVLVCAADILGRLSYPEVRCFTAGIFSYLKGR